MTDEPKHLTEEQISAFLVELAELTNRTGVAIGGCGCCGSPWLYPARKHAGYDVLPFREGTADVLRFKDSDDD